MAALSISRAEFDERETHWADDFPLLDLFFYSGLLFFSDCDLVFGLDVSITCFCLLVGLLDWGLGYFVWANEEILLAGEDLDTDLAWVLTGFICWVLVRLITLLRLYIFSRYESS